MDQAAKLREIVNKKEKKALANINLISVISGKGGVGKTTLVTKLYEFFGSSLIIDCDVNSPYFWLQKDKYNYCNGFDTFNDNIVIKSVEKSYKLDRYNAVIIDAGTGLNEVNRHYLKKSKIKIFVTTMENIALLNTMNLMKNVSGHKVLYIPTAKNEDILNMQDRINRYSKLHLDNSHILVCNDIRDLISLIERNRK